MMGKSKLSDREHLKRPPKLTVGRKDLPVAALSRAGASD